MNSIEIEEVLRKILHEQCEISSEKIELNANLYSDLELDSLALLTMVTEIENHFQIYLNENPDSPPQTVDEVINLIEKRVSESE